MINWQFPWKVGDSVGLKLDQMSDEEVRDPNALYAMINEINKLVAGYGFKIREIAAWPAFRKSAVDEEDYIRRQSHSR